MITLCLNVWMDPELTINTIESALPYVDNWCIQDLSTNPEVSKAVVRSTKGKPGKLFHNRTRKTATHEELQEMLLAVGEQQTDWILYLEEGEVFLPAGRRLDYLTSLESSSSRGFLFNVGWKQLELRMFRAGGMNVYPAMPDQLNTEILLSCLILPGLTSTSASKTVTRTSSVDVRANRIRR